MPYIKYEDREGALTEGPISDGELNYVIHELLTEYLSTRETNYETYNGIIGVLESIKLEFYRRLIAYHEDKKIKENGDIKLYVQIRKHAHLSEGE